MSRPRPGPGNAIVETRGRSGRLVPADVFSLRLSARGEHQLPERAYRTRGEAVDVVRRVLDAVGGLRVEDEQLGEAPSHRDGATVASWGVTVTGTAGDRDRLREVVARLAAVKHVGVDGPDWRLSPELGARVRRELLADAARTARAEAAVLADALGGAVGRLVHVTNQEQAENWRIEPVAAMQSTRGAVAALPGRTLELELEPARIEVAVTVTAEFEVVSEREGVNGQ